MEDTGRPEKYMTLHFANQIWKNNLAEVMKTSKTSEEVFELVQEFAKKRGMVPLKLYKEQPGYILNTLLIPWFKAALYLAATGVSDPETIDLTWVLDTGADPGQAPSRSQQTRHGHEPDRQLPEKVYRRRQDRYRGRRRVL